MNLDLHYRRAERGGGGKNYRGGREGCCSILHSPPHLHRAEQRKSRTKGEKEKGKKASTRDTSDQRAGRREKKREETISVILAVPLSLPRPIAVRKRGKKKIARGGRRGGEGKRRMGGRRGASTSVLYLNPSLVGGLSGGGKGGGLHKKGGKMVSETLSVVHLLKSIFITGVRERK